MSQAVDCELLLYADDTCLIFQHKDITEIETVLNKNFSMLWFVDNKLILVKIKQNQFYLVANIKSRSQNHYASNMVTLK